ncbi:hypothetical protein PFISCL1PPCAC_3466, partial [Pristionchus fissidentatus]
ISAALPASFDARTQWPSCSQIGAIRDQADCGACWAFAAAETMSDRVCIATNGTQQPVLSAEDMLSCCGDLCHVNGCSGGNPFGAWLYMATAGVCTGGEFWGNVGCKPYQFEPCGLVTVDGVSHNHNCKYDDPLIAQCAAACTNEQYDKPYNEDKYYGKSAYALKNDVDAIKQEIFDHGPVDASFTVYEDFDLYNGGIYQHVSGSVLGGHSVKIIGWGEEN